MKTKQDLLYPIVVILMCLVQSFCSATTNPMKPTGPLTNRTVTIEIAVADVLRSLAIDKADPVFNKVLLNTLERQKKEDKDFVTLFGESFTQLYPKTLLAPIFTSFELRERVSPTSTNEETLKVLGSEMIKVISQTLIILHIRLESLGMGNANFQKLPLSNRYMITLQNVQDPERLKKMLQSSAKIGFWETYKLPEIFPFIADANKKLQAIKPASANVKKTNLFDLLMLSIDGDNKPINRATVGYASIKDTSAIIKMLKMEKLTFPRNLAFAWTIKPEKENPLIHELVAIRISTRDGLAPLEGDVIVDAKDTIGRSGQVILEMMMNAEGARIFRRLTNENVGNELAIMIDGLVYACPQVITEIPNGRVSITGDFTKEEIHDLATMIKAGRLPVAVKVISDVEVAH
jgi:SecD/SecF fusion protein